MAPNQKTWLVNKSSKLGKLDDLADILRKDEAWTLLSEDERQRLYSMLPPPQEGEPPHNIDVNPMRTMYRPYIEEELHRWQDDLREGKETKTWREQAIEAGRERESGVWDEWKEAQRELDWGVKDEGSGEDGGGQGSGDDEGKKDDAGRIKGQDQRESAKREKP